MNSPCRFAAPLIVVVILQALAGCGSSPPPEPPPPVKDTAIGDLVGTMDRARGVQDTVDQQKQSLDQALERSTGDAASGAGNP